MTLPTKSPVAPATARVWRHCPQCGNDGGELHWMKGTLRIVCCSGCAMVFANPVDGQFVDGAFYEQIATSFYLSPDKLRGDYSPVRFKRELRLFRRFCRNGKVLDVGCSTGGFLRQLQRRFPNDYELLGSDVAGPALSYAEEQGIPVSRAPFLSPEFGSRTFDAITFWAVLEHVADPRAFLAQAAQRLNPGGHCFLLVPNLDSLAVRILGARYRYVMPEHLNYFNRDTMKRFVARERSFELVALRSTHFNPVVIWQDWRSHGTHVPGADRASLLQRTNRWKQSVLLSPVRVLYRMLEGVLGICGLADNLVVVLRRRSH